MPTSVEDASIAVIDTELDVRESNIDAEYNVSSVDQLNAALDAEEGELQGYAEDVLESGADVAFVTEDVADRVASQLARKASSSPTASAPRPPRTSSRPPAQSASARWKPSTRTRSATPTASTSRSRAMTT